MSVAEELALMAHLMRRAGFGAPWDQLETYVSMGYEATVEELLHPEDQPALEDDLLLRYVPYINVSFGIQRFQSYWIYRMINTRRPLEEKMALFCHQLFATSHRKVACNPAVGKQIEMFRRYALGDFRTLLLELSRDPAMLYWLDNWQNRQGSPNENFSRELLELFCLGEGNYTETDVKECARAFTGWGIYPGLGRDAFGDYWWEFEYRPEDHDNGEKEFLGQHGRFSGEDVIDLIVCNPANAQFIARKLYAFFVSDQPDPVAIKALAESYLQHGGQLRSVLRTLFNSGFFKAEQVRYAKIKSPVELVVGLMRLVDEQTSPKPKLHEIATACTRMGQELYNPPSVEGWHLGQEWLDSGSLIERVNFAAEQVADITKPGVRRIIESLISMGPRLAPDELVDHCLELTGPVRLAPAKRDGLVTYVQRRGELLCGNEQERQDFVHRVAGLLRLIVAEPEFQFV